MYVRHRPCAGRLLESEVCFFAFCIWHCLDGALVAFISVFVELCWNLAVWSVKVGPVMDDRMPL
jgi:hypothetical protein